LKVGALALILELYHAVRDGSIRKGTLRGSLCNSTVIIVGQVEGFFEAEVITEELAQQSTVMQQDVVRSTALNNNNNNNNNNNKFNRKWAVTRWQWL
jgi:hypothetical protein